MDCFVGLASSQRRRFSKKQLGFEIAHDHLLEPIDGPTSHAVLLKSGMTFEKPRSRGPRVAAPFVHRERARQRS
jgi:hypothetical protein